MNALIGSSGSLLWAACYLRHFGAFMPAEALVVRLWSSVDDDPGDSLESGGGGEFERQFHDYASCALAGTRCW